MKLPGGEHYCLVYCSSCNSFTELITESTCRCKQSGAKIINNKIHISGVGCFIIAIDSTEFRANILAAEYDRMEKIKRRAWYSLDAVIVGPENEAIHKSKTHG